MLVDESSRGPFNPAFPPPAPRLAAACSWTNRPGAHSIADSPTVRGGMGIRPCRAPWRPARRAPGGPHEIQSLDVGADSLGALPGSRHPGPEGWHGAGFL